MIGRPYLLPDYLRNGGVFLKKDRLLNQFDKSFFSVMIGSILLVSSGFGSDKSIESMLLFLNNIKRPDNKSIFEVRESIKKSLIFLL